jgi:hypothetical protein
LQNYAPVVFYGWEVLYDAKKFHGKKILFWITLPDLVVDYLLVRTRFIGIIRFWLGDSFRSFASADSILGVDDISRGCRRAHICFNI